MSVVRYAEPEVYAGSASLSRAALGRHGAGAAVDHLQALGFPAGATLTPELILALAEKRLERADQQIAAITRDIESTGVEMEDIARKRRVLQAIREQEPVNGSGIQLDPKDPSDREADLVDVNDDGHPRTVGELLDDEEITIQPASGNRITAAQLDSQLEQLDERSREINRGMEMRTLTLQQLVHSRAEVLSMATELLRSMSDSTKAIIQNIG